MVFDEQLTATLTEGGVDVEGVLNAWAKGHETLYMKHLKRFPENERFEQFIDGIGTGDMESAYRAVHTLKADCATLGFRDLRMLTTDICEYMKDPDENKQSEAQKNGKALAILDSLPAQVSDMIPVLEAEVNRMKALTSGI